MIKKTFITLSFLIIYTFAVKAQTNDNDFNTFWSKFKTAILSDDAETIADLTCFPFITGWLSIDNMKDKYDRKDFIAEYKSLVPSKEDMEKIKYNQEVTYKNEDGTVILNLWKDENGNFILNLTNDFNGEGMGYSDYTFSNINGEYKLKQLVLGD